MADNVTRILYLLTAKERERERGERERENMRKIVEQISE